MSGEHDRFRPGRKGGKKMKKEETKKFHVDVDKVEFKKSRNGLYSVSKTNKDGYYITRVDDEYEVVEEKTNCAARWLHDLSDLEEG